MQWFDVHPGENAQISFQITAGATAGQIPALAEVTLRSDSQGGLALSYTDAVAGPVYARLAPLSAAGKSQLENWGAPDAAWLAHRMAPPAGGADEAVWLRICRARGVYTVPPDGRFTIHLSSYLIADIRKETGDAHTRAEAWLEAEFTLDSPAGKLIFLDAGPAGSGQSTTMRLIGERFTLTLSRSADLPFTFLAAKLRPLANARSVWRRVLLCRTPVEFVRRTYPGVLPRQSRPAAADGGYLDIWSRYQELDRLQIEQEALRIGSVAYKSWRYLGDQLVELFLSDPLPTAWHEIADLEVIAFETDREQSVLLGEVVERTETRLLVKASGRRPPAKGFLASASTGSIRMFKRRRSALRKVRSGECELPNLNEWLNDPSACNEPVTDTTPVMTAKLSKALKGRRLTPSQEEAVKKVLHTPDIALVFGPPGTGKTTVIRAIIQRLNELGRRPVLLSSYQHVAVDNVVQGMDYDGVPALRLGGPGDVEGFEVHARTFVQRLREAAGPKLVEGDALQSSSLTRTLEERLHGYMLRPGQLNEQMELVEGVLTLSRAHLSAELRVQGQSLLERIRVQSALAAPAPGGRPAAGEELDAAVRRVRAGLPRSFAAYDDDGPERLADLRTALQRWARTAGTDTAGVDVLLRQVSRAVARAASEEPEELAAFEALLEKLGEAVDALLPAPAAQRGATPDGAEPGAPVLALIAWADSVITHVAQVESQRPESRYDVLDQFIRRLESDRKGLRDLLKKRSPALGVTCQQAVRKQYELYHEPFDFVIIDEAARANPLDLLIPLSMGSRVVLVGDPNQLPHMLEPDLESALVEKTEADRQEAVRGALNESLFERLYRGLPANRKQKLTEQFRMNDVLCQLVSDAFYGGELKSGSGVPVNDTGLYRNRPIAWVPVRPEGERLDRRTPAYSWVNPVEARVLAGQVAQALRECPGLAAPDALAKRKIGVITFYADQVPELEQALGPNRQHCDIGTVDAFQGQEYEVAFLSAVRSNRAKQVGHLALPNRLCVAFSRAQKLLVIVGDPDTVTTVGPFADAWQLCEGGVGIVVADR